MEGVPRDEAMKRPLFEKPLRRYLFPENADGVIAAFEALTGKALTEERIADIRANYAAFSAGKAAASEVRSGREAVMAAAAEAIGDVGPASFTEVTVSVD